MSGTPSAGGWGSGAEGSVSVRPRREEIQQPESHRDGLLASTSLRGDHRSWSPARLRGYGPARAPSRLARPSFMEPRGRVGRGLVKTVGGAENDERKSQRNKVTSPHSNPVTKKCKHKLTTDCLDVKVFCVAKWRLRFLSRPRVLSFSHKAPNAAHKAPPLAARFHRRSKTKQVRGDSTALNEDVAVYRSRAPNPRRSTLDAHAPEFCSHLPRR